MKLLLRSPFLGISITVGLTIFPVTQIILLYLNGGLSYLLALPFGANTNSEVVENAAIVLNTLLIVIGCLAFYFSLKPWKLYFSTFLIMFSGQALIVFVSGILNGGDDYFWGWLAMSGIPVLLIIILSMNKSNFISLETKDDKL
ncbi:hypothetical protein [Roseivirga sp. E12]|uniref:hypothetical protein n=1 Tax=Roseivirga sp. E12 TaxID=2819237 RepID=UPI001ABCA164|nr:hypothetical protein [Roseivirga sp. E12]MBO3696811.1 hypothetical protein [Roseivirga sp. E12]